jgi:hypothetical protein
MNLAEWQAVMEAEDQTKANRDGDLVVQEGALRPPPSLRHTHEEASSHAQVGG